MGSFVLVFYIGFYYLNATRWSHFQVFFFKNEDWNKNIILFF